MKHNQFYKYLDEKIRIALDDEIKLYTSNSLLISHHNYYDQQQAQDNLLRWLCERWHFALYTDNPPYNQYTILLHRYGWDVTTLLSEVEIAVRQLTPHVSKGFERASDNLLNLLNTPPKTLTRRPPRSFMSTQLKTDNLISIHLNGCYHFAFVHSVSHDRSGDYPVIEFYRETHTQPGQPLIDHQALGRRYADGMPQVARYGVFGLIRLPDPANQITLVQSSYDTPPEEGHLAKPTGLYTFIDFTQLNTYIKELFANP